MINELDSSLQKIIEHLKSEFQRLQIGRANTSLVEDIELEVYGAKSVIKNNANISCPDAKTIKIEPWDKNILQEIEKAILAKNIGINPQNMGEFILCPIPPMTEERRKLIIKTVKEQAEKSKISIRNIRQDFLKKVKKQKDEKEISEDEQKKLDKQIEEKINDKNKQIEEITKNKENDILNI